MNPAMLRRLGIAVSAILVVWGFLLFVKRLRQDRPAEYHLTKIDSATVDAIVVTSATDTVHLARQGSEWTVNGHHASAGSVKDFVTALNDTTTGELIAENASSHQRLGLDSTGARLVTVKAGSKTLASYLVGHRGPSYESAYVRNPSAAAAYVVKGRLSELAERRVDDWRDKTIVAANPDSIVEVAVERGKMSYRLTRAGKDWTFAGGAPADSAGVANLLSQFKAMNATSFATKAQADSADFAKPERRVRLGMAGGKAATVLAMDSTAGGFWVRRDSLPTVFRIDGWTADQLTPADSTLKKRK